MTTKFKEGSVLRHLRLKSELSISSLASEIGVDQSVIADFESDCREHSSMGDIVKVQEWIVSKTNKQDEVLELPKIDPTLEMLGWLSDSNPAVFEKFKLAIERVVDIMGGINNSVQVDISVTQLEPRTWNF